MHSFSFRTKKLAGSLVYCATLAIVCLALLLRGKSTSEVIAVGMFGLLYFGIVAAACGKLLSGDVSADAERAFKTRSILFYLGGAIAGGIFLEALTLFGSPVQSPLVVSDWSLRQTACMILVAFTLEVGVGVLKKRNAYVCMRAWLERNKQALLDALVILAACLVLAGVIAALGSLTTGSEFRPLLFFFAACFLCAGFLLFLRGHGGFGCPERIFIVLALSIGCSIVFMEPLATGVSWDDGTHYAHALGLSYFCNPVSTEADRIFLTSGGWWDSSFEEISASLNAAYTAIGAAVSDGFTTPIGDTLLAYSTLGYIPSAVGLWLGRLLHLPFSATIVLGRLFNLFSYVGVCFAAIRIAPTKKVLMACIALLPTSLFLAANYSYDPWVTSFMMLAVALALREMHSERTITTRAFLRIALVFLIGLGPKAIYFPLIGILFLMPKKKFLSSEQRRRFYLLVVGLGLLAILTFIVPLASSGGEASDTRGGSSVSSTGQIAYILSNPLGYCMMLGDFLFNTYLALPFSAGYSTYFAYLGGLGMFAGLSAAFLMAVALLDAQKSDWVFATRKCRIWAASLFFLSIVLIATALYISYTPVGHTTVNGCQHRYLIPLLFPLLAFSFNVKIENRMNKTAFSLACQAFMGALGFVCVGFLLTSASL